jgi:hypothetical protein
MIRKLARLGPALARRWKYRFRRSRYRAFLDLCAGREVATRGFFPLQAAIVDEAQRLREAFGRAGELGPVGSVSVVIPHYNQQSFLVEAIESARSQTFQPEEIIVVDDVSSDPAAVRAAEARFASDPRVRFIYSREKLYAGGARQLGTGLARGDAVSYLDADDIMHPRRLELVRDALNSQPDCVFVITSVTRFLDTAPVPMEIGPDELQRSLIGPRALSETIARRFAIMRLSWIDPATGKVPWYAWGAFGSSRVFPPSSGTLTVRRAIAGLARWPTPTNYVFTPYEDYEYCLLLHAATSGGYQIDLPLLYYRQGSSTNAPSEMV